MQTEAMRTLYSSKNP